MLSGILDQPVQTWKSRLSAIRYHRKFKWGSVTWNGERLYFGPRDEKMKHKDSGKRCLVYHPGRDQCIECCQCHEWIKPEDWGKECIPDCE